MFEGISILFRKLIEAQWPFVIIGHGRVRITQARQIRDARFGEQKIEHGVIPFLRLEFRDAAVRVGHVSEHNRLGRTRLLAGRPRYRALGFLESDVARRAGLDLLRDLGLLEALETETTL